MHIFFFVSTFTALATLRVLFIVYKAATTPLRDVPGPFWARFTNLWWLHANWAGDAHLTNVALHKRYAKAGENHARIIRLGPNLFSIASPDKIVYGIGSQMPKGSWYDTWKHPSPDRWTLFPDRNMKHHAEARRKFQNLYSMTSLRAYEAYVDECADIFVQRLREMALAKDQINLGHWLQCYAFDVIGKITYSERFGFLDQGKDMGGTMKSLDSLFVYGALLGIYAWLHPVMYRIMEYVPGSGAGARNYLGKFVQERMTARIAARQELVKSQKGVGFEDDPKDFLDRILDMQEEGSKGVTAYHVFMLGLGNIVAGSDTTAISLSSVCYYLSRSPTSLARLREEITSSIKAGECDNNRVSFSQSIKMTYLQACVREGLRMHPATELPLWRVVPEGGAEICGHDFPAGSEVGINTWVAHTDNDIWGEDADVFRPERWIEAAKDENRLKLMEAYYMPVSDTSPLPTSANDRASLVSDLGAVSVGTYPIWKCVS
jgi:cytochrome P450